MPTIEQQAYGKPRVVGVKVDRCGLSTVDVQAKIVINDAKHAGIVTHVCKELKNHEELICRCACGHHWTKNVK